MIRRPPRSTRTDTLFPYTTLFRSARRARAEIQRVGGVSLDGGYRACSDVSSADAFLLARKFTSFCRRRASSSSRSLSNCSICSCWRALRAPRRVDVVTTYLSRSEEQRVGKECVCALISREWPSH